MDLEKIVDSVRWDYMAEDVLPGEEIYMQCPVRNATEEEKEFLELYKSFMGEKFGVKVHYPATDTNQEGSDGGYRICKDHTDEINRMKEFHSYWNGSSSGSYVDLGTALYLNFKEGKKIKLINRQEVESKDIDPYTYALLALDAGYNEFEIFDSKYELADKDEIEVEWATPKQLPNGETWKPSMKQYVDLGFYLQMHFKENKNIKLKNRSDVEEVVRGYEAKGVNKSYEHVLLKLDDLARQDI